LGEKVDKAAVDRGSEPRPLEDQGRIKLHETGARFDFRQRSFWAVDTARADQWKLVVHAQMGLRQHPGRRQEKRAA